MQVLCDLTLNELNEFIKKHNLPAYRAKQVYENMLMFKSYDEMSNVPKELKDLLKSNFYDKALEISEDFTSKDNSQKFLYTLCDKNVIEGVFIPNNYGNTLCVSTQVGCRMGCAFCASGIFGLNRNLTAGEILSQVVAINALKGGNLKKRAIANIVMMGMGEPLDNFENVTKFIDLATSADGLNISQRNISLSTVGVVPKIKELADLGYKLTLAISLHAATDEARNRIIPLSIKYPLKELINAADYYFEATGRRIVYEYALIDGVNVSPLDAKNLVSLLKGKPCHINLIPLNEVKEKGLKKAKSDQIKQFIDILEKNKLSVTLRRSAGSDIDGACGQLRSKYVEKGKAVAKPDD